MGALASSGSPWGGVGVRAGAVPHLGSGADLVAPPPPKTNSPSFQGPLPHLIYRTPLLPVPLGCREPGKGGKVGLGRGPAVLPSPGPSPQAAYLLPLLILLL